MRILHISIIAIISIVSVLLPRGLALASCPSSSAGTSISAAQYLAGCSQDGGGVSVDNGTDKNAVKELVKTVAERAIQFGALLAIGAIVYAGIQYTTSYGDDEKIKKAKMTGIYGLIGLVLMLVSFSLVDVIVNFLIGLWS